MSRNLPELDEANLPKGRERLSRLEDRVVRMLCEATSGPTGPWDEEYTLLLRENRDTLDKHYVDLADFQVEFPGWPVVMTARILKDLWEFNLWDALRPKSHAQNTLVGHYRKAFAEAEAGGRFKWFEGIEGWRPRFGLVFPIRKRGKFLLHNDWNSPSRRKNTFGFRGLVLGTLDGFLEQVDWRWTRALEDERQHMSDRRHDDPDPVESSRR